MIVGNSNIYDKSIVFYKCEVDAYWKKLQHDVELLKARHFFFDNPWDMECCSEVYKLNKYHSFDKTPNGDPEWVFQFCRFEWLSKFILLYYKTNDASLLEIWNNFVFSFFEKNNYDDNGLLLIEQQSNSILNRILRRFKGCFITKKSPTYRTLDTAIRNYSLLINIESCPNLLSSN